MFAFGSIVTPPGTGVYARLVMMKSCFLLFDLGTLFVVIGLLRLVRRHVGWSLVYGWCPLVMKEIANSGHLDAVAIFLATSAVYVAVRATFGKTRRPMTWHTAAAVN